MFKNVGKVVNKTQIRFLGIKNVTIKNPADLSTEIGIQAGTGPARVPLEEGKQYSYCSCGHSKKQPFCDGSHKVSGLTNLRPVRFIVDTSGTYPLCQCKKTTIRPICDGTHKKLNPVESK